MSGTRAASVALRGPGASHGRGCGAKRLAARGPRLAALVLCALVALAAGPAPAATRDPGVDELTDAFLRIAGIGEFGPPVPGIVRWEGATLDLALVGRPEPDQVAALDALLPLLSAATGMELRTAPPVATPPGGAIAGGMELGLSDPVTHLRIFGNPLGGDPFIYALHGRGGHMQVWRANIIVFFGLHEEMRAIARLAGIDARLRGDVESGTSPCFGHMSIDRTRNVVLHAVVALRSDIPGWARRRCVHEEVTQSLGLRNDLPGSDISLFDDAMMLRRTELTRHDWMFLRLLYDRSLPPGLHGIELRRRVRPLVEHHLRRALD